LNSFFGFSLNTKFYVINRSWIIAIHDSRRGIWLNRRLPIGDITLSPEALQVSAARLRSLRERDRWCDSDKSSDDE
jgi:hypothetical protein